MLNPPRNRLDRAVYDERGGQIDAELQKLTEIMKTDAGVQSTRSDVPAIVVKPRYRMPPWEMDREPIEPRQGRNRSRNVRDGVSPLCGCGNKIDAYPRLTPWATDLAPLCGCLRKTATFPMAHTRQLAALIGYQCGLMTHQTHMDKLKFIGHSEWRILLRKC